MKEKEIKSIVSICESLKKATPTQREYMMGFAEGMAYASENREDVQESEEQ